MTSRLCRISIVKAARISILLAGSCVLFSGTSIYLRAQAPAATSESPAARSKALSNLFAEIWDDRMKHSPEYASLLGDK